MHGTVKSPAEAAREMAVLGHQRIEAGDWDNAATLLTAALDEDPDCYEAVLELGVVAAHRGHAHAAGAFARRAASLRPDDAAAWSNLGNQLMAMQRYAEAEPLIRRAVELDPDHRAHRHNLGLVLFYQNHGAEAAVELARAVEFYEAAGESSVGARSDLSLATMKAGRLHEGLVLNECRWEGPLAKSAAWQCGARPWEGEDLDGKTILVHHEQGYGDTIHFCRFLPKLTARGARVVLAVPGALVRLVAGQDLCDEVVDLGRLSDLVRVSRGLDYHAPMLSVVKALGVEFEDLPAVAEPYLRTVEPAPGRISPRVRGGGFRVGVAWAGSVGYRRNSEKSARLEDLLPLASVPGVRLYSLQVGPFREDIEKIGAGGLVVDLAGQIGDFADTADAVTQLDLVISVDTGTFHLAAALGRPTWLMQSITPCWRWHRGVKPWYGSAEEYHQLSPGDWSEPVAEMKRDLERLIGGRG